MKGHKSINNYRTDQSHAVHSSGQRGVTPCPRSAIPRLAIVVPCYNESETLPSSNRQLLDLLDSMKASGVIAPSSYILYVDDGSRDATWDYIVSLNDESEYVGGLCLSGNSGQQNALIAGMEYVADKCDAVITIDADLQDDIKVIPLMIEEYMKGYDLVFGVRNRRDSDTWLKRSSSHAFYRMMKRLSGHYISNHSDFRLMSRRVISVLEKYGERNIFLRGIIPSMGFFQSQVIYDRLPRVAGETKYSYPKMFNLAADGITSFSIRPVRMVTWLGVIFIIIALGMLTFVLWQRFSGRTTEGWASLMLSVWFCSGTLLVALGIIGEYIGKIYSEVKHRPRYIIDMDRPPSAMSANHDSSIGQGGDKI